MNPQIVPTIEALLNNHQLQRRTPVSVMFPVLKKPLMQTRRSTRRVVNALNLHLTKEKHYFFLSTTVFQHQSVLRRKLGTVDPALQESKITNLRLAANAVNGIIIKPGESFSFWNAVGKPTAARGFAPGLVLSNGKAGVDIGGGLCQMANLLYWMFLHLPVTVTERHHHSRDVFPDSGRTLPFGSGATVFYNYYDLKIENTSNQPIQLKVWLTDSHLHGEILSVKKFAHKYHVIEKNHCFANIGATYFRYNELYREVLDKETGTITRTDHLTTNFAPVLYEVTPDYIATNNFATFELAAA